MIGQVRFLRHGIARVASLVEDGTWRVLPPLPRAEAAVVDPVLAAISAGYGGPGDGPFGPRQISEAATYLALSYQVTGSSLAPKRPHPPGTVY